MMCACEREFATRYLSHQIHYDKYSDTQEEAEITLGFQRIFVVRAEDSLPRHNLPCRSQTGRQRLLDIIETIQDLLNGPGK